MSKQQNTFTNITVVGIDGCGRAAHLIPAINHSLDALPGAKALLISNKPIQTDIPVKLIKQPLDYTGYSHFMIYCLHNFIETDYVLVVQADGFVINPKAWSSSWFQYDYIGAPTHAALVENKFMVNYDWVSYQTERPFVVQNGGFSFRSKRLLEAPSRFGIVMHTKALHHLNNEDVQITTFMRPALEGLGLKFAPLDEAKYFSIEHLNRAFHCDIDVHQVFGQHSRFRQLLNHNPKTLLWSMSSDKMNRSDDELKVYNFFVNSGYMIRHST